MNRVIITVVGKDRVGIMAKVCNYLAQHNINILDVSQTIVSGFFNMMMVTDFQEVSRDFGDIAGDLEKIGAEIGVSIKAQREDIFDKMHRI